LPPPPPPPPPLPSLALSKGPRLTVSSGQLASRVMGSAG